MEYKSKLVCMMMINLKNKKNKICTSSISKTENHTARDKLINIYIMLI